jgi:putative hydrolase of the HAD superfamily
MAITTIFSDVGGVLLTNGWDRHSRARAVEKFHLDAAEIEKRHDEVFPDLEVGRASLDKYIEHTVFYEPRSFSRDDFRAFMFEQSTPYPEALQVLARLAGAGRYFLGTLNNESLELNEYRIAKFGLSDYFRVFISSCYVDARKPDVRHYERALQITHRKPEECLFIDDRPPNVEPAARLGMRTIRYENPSQLVADFGKNGIVLDSH